MGEQSRSWAGPGKDDLLKSLRPSLLSKILPPSLPPSLPRNRLRLLLLLLPRRGEKDGRRAATSEELVEEGVGEDSKGEEGEEGSFKLHVVFLAYHANR